VGLLTYTGCVAHAEPDLVAQAPPPLENAAEVMSHLTSESPGQPAEAVTLAADDLSTSTVETVAEVGLSPIPAMEPIPSLEPTPELERLTFEEEYLARVEAAYDHVLGVEGEFLQTRVSNIFLETRESRARFFVRKPGRFRMTYFPKQGTPSQPESVHYYDNGTYYMYIPEFNQVEKMKVNTQDESVEALNLMLLGFSLKAADVFSVYRVSLIGEEALPGDAGTSTTLSFVPLEPAALRYLNLSFVARDSGDADESVPLPRHIYYVEDNDDEVELLIGSLGLSTTPEALAGAAELGEAKFVPTFPPDAEILENNP